MLLKIEIPETKDTPYVILDPENAKYEITGNSMPENAYDFYRQINDWFAIFLRYQTEPFEINFRIEYFNSSTTKELFELLTKIDNAVKVSYMVKWFASDGDELIEDLGYEIQDLLKIPIEVILEE